MSNWHNEATDRLMKVIQELNSVEDCYRFFEDLCTVKELRDMAQRLEVAVMLSRKHNYHEISKKTGVSTATISRVSKCVSYGSGGYAAAVKRIEEKEKNT